MHRHGRPRLAPLARRQDFNCLLICEMAVCMYSCQETQLGEIQGYRTGVNESAAIQTAIYVG